MPEGSEGIREEPPYNFKNIKNNGGPTVEPSQPSQPSQPSPIDTGTLFCKYCDFKTTLQTEYNKHTVMRHPGRPGY